MASEITPTVSPHDNIAQTTTPAMAAPVSVPQNDDRVTQLEEKVNRLLKLVETQQYTIGSLTRRVAQLESSRAYSADATTQGATPSPNEGQCQAVQRPPTQPLTAPKVKMDFLSMRKTFGRAKIEQAPPSSAVRSDLSHCAVPTQNGATVPSPSPCQPRKFLCRQTMAGGQFSPNGPTQGWRGASPSNAPPRSFNSA